MSQSTASDNGLILKNHVRRLQKLKEQCALFGAIPPPEIVLEIKDIESEIKKIQAMVHHDLLDSERKKLR